jgi:hypothetical protein
MAALIVPQVQVKWGDRNLSAYNLPNSDGPQSIVYNTTVTLGGDQWPTAEFMWNPSGPAFKVYDECVTKGIEEEIQIRFYYVNGPYILFKFQFNGSEITYGNDMQIKTTLACKNSFKSNGVRATAMEDYSKGKFNAKGIDLLKAMNDIESAYGKPIPVKLSDKSKEDLQKISLLSWQYKDQTYGAIRQNIAQQAGDKLALTNISSNGQANQFGPLSWEGKEKKDSVMFPPGPGGTPKGEQRYGYILGPTIIQSFTRTMQYPPQTQGLDASVTQPGSTPNKEKQPKVPGSQKLIAQKQQDQAQKDAQKKSVTNPSSPSTVKGNKFSKNDVGPEKQQFMQKEDQGVEFQTSVFMCPAVVGIKPQDVIYIPSLKIGDAIMEDYKVKSVTYTQDGALVTVGIQATRTPGLNTLMNTTAGEKFKTKADSLKTVEDWTAYAWTERMGG